ncbi:hypothetical protein Scep_014097 [Stephania cephalantha]|uniref:Uncharacterized protein n=1 Tax=Stephania cephalantha TaxID=152367 RepID=A0AAP0J358_9MAGN
MHTLIETRSETFLNATFGWVNVKDVAYAHILAFQTPSAKGRYRLVERVAHFSDIVKALHELYPRISFPQKSTTTEDDKSKVYCETDQRPPKTTNLRFVAEQIKDHLRRQETYSDVQSQNNGTVKQRISESTESTTDR